MKSLTAHRKHPASFKAINFLAIAPLCLMLATANTCVHAQSTSSPADWTQFLRDNMQRWNPYETVIGVNNVGGLQLQWKNPIGTYIYSGSSPAVANGIVYFGSDDGNVYALNASTGDNLWTFATGGNVFSAPAVTNGIVYVGSIDGNLYALNANTGAKLWSYATGDAVSSSPTVANGVVYFASESYTGNVYALNASTGAKLWSYGPAFFAVDAAPAVANGVVYINDSYGNVHALNAGSGALLWSNDTGSDSVGGSSSLAVANGVVYVGSTDGHLYALNASTGSELWSYNTGKVYYSPAVADGVVYVNAAGDSVYALNATTGAKLWTYATENYPGSSPAVANGVVYIADESNLYALNANSGVKLWSRATGDGLTSSPAIVDGRVYVRNGEYQRGGNVYAFGLASGGADLFLRINPSATTVHQGDLLTFAFPVWNLGPGVAEGEVLSNLQVPAGTTFDYLRISGTPGLGTCTHPPYGGTGQIVCHEGDGMAPDTTWTVRLTVKVTAPAGSTITESAATMADTPDPNMANNMATVSVKVQ